MKKLFFLILAALLLSPVLTFAEAKKKDRPDTEIETAMQKISTAFRQLRRQASDPAQNASSLESIATIRTNALAARKHIPLRAADVPEGERGAFVANFQKKMDEFLAVAAKLEAALKDGKNADAVQLVAELDQTRKAGHRDFERPDNAKKK